MRKTSRQRAFGETAATGAAGSSFGLIYPLGFSNTPSHLNESPIPVTQPLTSPTLGPKLQHYVDEQVMAGAVLLIADKTEILSLEAIGWADIAAKKPLQVDDIFWVASMTKPVTGVALLMLVDDGLVSVDDPVEKYIPEFRDLKVLQPDGSLTTPRHPVLIREILSHTGGMRFLNSKDRQIIDSVPLKVSVQHSLLEPLLYEPGTKYSYSNEGTDAAGLVVEIVSGQPFEQFLQERLFTPLGMVDTTFHPSSAQLERLAKTYTATEDKEGLQETRTQFLTYPLDGPGRHPAPGGGLFSTARDMGRFCQMLLNGGTFEGKTYLSKEATRALTTKQTGDEVEDIYGFGMGASADGQSFGHGGALKTNMGVEQGVVRVFLVQQQGDWARGNPNEDFNIEVARLNSSEGSSSAAPAVEVGITRN